MPLQRVLADFGADHAFGRVPDKLREHYGIDMPVSTIRLTTGHHAQCLFEQEQAREVHAGAAKGRVLIGEMDGSMVPVVEVAKDADDKRKRKTLAWKEARLCIAHELGSVTPVFCGHFAGGAEESGRQWECCAGVAPVLALTAAYMRWGTVHRGSPTRWRPGSAHKGLLPGGLLPRLRIPGRGGSGLCRQRCRSLAGSKRSLPPPFPGNAAILAAISAGETPALPGGE